MERKKKKDLITRLKWKIIDNKIEIKTERDLSTGKGKGGITATYIK